MARTFALRRTLLKGGRLVLGARGKQVCPRLVGGASPRRRPTHDLSDV
jgi:hypothetical protein